MQTLFFKTVVDLCRTYKKTKGTPKKCVDPAHLCFFFKKSSCKPESESLQFLLAPFTSHKHISTSFLHSNAASSVLFKT